MPACRESKIAHRSVGNDDDRVFGASEERLRGRPERQGMPRAAASGGGCMECSSAWHSTPPHPSSIQGERTMRKTIFCVLVFATCMAAGASVAAVCDDGSCDPGETCNNCPEDCCPDIGCADCLIECRDHGFPACADPGCSTPPCQADSYTCIDAPVFCCTATYNCCSGCNGDGGDDGGTAVELLSFAAHVEDGAVVLRWETESEIDNEIFEVLRSRTAAGEFEVVNEVPIPAEGGPSFGAEYEFVDDTVRRGRTYYYLLEDVDSFGVSTLHGEEACTYEEDPDCEPLRIRVLWWPPCGRGYKVALVVPVIVWAGGAARRRARRNTRV